MIKSMRTVLAASTFAAAAGASFAQDIIPAGDFRTCPMDQTRQGVAVVADRCGALRVPTVGTAYASLGELERAQAERDRFNAEVAAYGQCVTDFINDYRRPGADASSKAPDQAACAHAWAEHKATEIVKDVGLACVDFSNRTMVDAQLEPWSGRCFPDVSSRRG